MVNFEKRLGGLDPIEEEPQQYKMKAKLLGQRVVTEDIYQHQNETIITWTDPATNADYALSFQENEGCQDMWEQILSTICRSR